MIKWRIKSTEINYTKKLPPEQIKQFEAKLIAEYLGEKSYKIALDVLGMAADSHEFANLISKNSTINKSIDFIIGGAFGLDSTVLDLVNIRLSLSPLTMPHQIAKIVLLEQIYRAQTIIQNHPYHK